MPDTDAIDPLVGQMLDGRYRIEALIGIGGMGRVYRGVRDQLGKAVAIKVLTPEIKENERETLIARFTREAQATAAIRHQNVVEIFDFGQTHDCIYFVMELLDGVMLADIIGQGKTIEPARLVWLAAQIARGLHAAHKLDIIHRDVKPGNVFVCMAADGRERAKVLDFGLAKLNDGMRLTTVGMVFGTASYMAPEQAKGGSLDARTDIYALGCLMFEAIAGRPPFQGENFMMTLGKHLREPPPRLSEVCPDAKLPAGLDDIIIRALAKDPADRFPNMGAVANALARLEVPEPEVRVQAASARHPDEDKGAPQERTPVLIAMLYIYLSHSTDDDLSTVELERISTELEAWTRSPSTALERAMSEYALLEARREEVAGIGALTQELRVALPADARREVLAGMWRIAGADGRILESEREFIKLTVARWSSPPSPVEVVAKAPEPTHVVPPAFTAPASETGGADDPVPPAPLVEDLVSEPVERTEFVRPVFESETPPPMLREPRVSEPVEKTEFARPAFESPPFLGEIQPPADPELSAARGLDDRLRHLSDELESLRAGSPGATGAPEGEAKWLARLREFGADRDGVDLARATLRAHEHARALRTCAALVMLTRRDKDAPAALVALSTELDPEGIEAIITALELRPTPGLSETLARGLELSNAADRHRWLGCFARLGLDPGPTVVRQGLDSDDDRDVAATLQVLCAHEARLDYRLVLPPHFFSPDLAARQAALVAGLVLDSPGAALVCRQRARDPSYEAVCLLHVLQASTPELEELARWSRDPSAPAHVGFALGYGGRRVGISAAQQLASESPLALAGFRFATGFADDVAEIDGWWSGNRARFEPGCRYIGGQPADPASLKAILHTADTRLWQAFRAECVVSSRGATTLPATGLASTLRASVDALKPDDLSWLASPPG